MFAKSSNIAENILNNLSDLFLLYLFGFVAISLSLSIFLLFLFPSDVTSVDIDSIGYTLGIENIDTLFFFSLLTAGKEGSMVCSSTRKPP